MILKVFSIRDIKADAYDKPFFLATVGQAVRAFSDEVERSDSMLNKHPEDYILFELGEYNDALGVFTCLPAPRQLIAGSDVSAGRGQAA